MPDAAPPPYVPADPAEERAEFNRQKAIGARLALKGIRLNRDFPFWTRPLTDENRWKPPKPVVQEQRGPESEAHILQVWPQKQIFRADEPIVIYARLLDSGKPVAAASLTGTTESMPSLGRPAVGFTFAGDDDLLYSAVVPAPPEMLAEQPGSWGFRVYALLDSEPIQTINAFFVWPTSARLTGTYRDALEEGSLAVYAGVEADAEAEIQVRGELHGPRGEGIAFGWANQTVPQGRSEVRLVFYGKAIHDSGIDGPYRVQHVVLAIPRLKVIGPEATEVAHETRAYRAAQFRDDAFNADDPMFDEQIKEYEDLLRRAEAGELDPGADP